MAVQCSLATSELAASILARVLCQARSTSLSITLETPEVSYAKEP